MKRIVSLLALVLFTGACYSQESGLQGPKDFKTTIENTKDIQLVDVRTQKEFDEGHIPNATLIDYYKQDFRAQMSKLDKNKPVAVYCTIGGRSGNTARMLKQLGFTKVFDLRGGVIDWQKAGYKLVKD